MAEGHVNRTSLASNYQNVGDVYSDTKTEGAMEVIAQQIDANYDAAVAINNGLTGHKNASILDHPDSSVTTSKLSNQSVTTAKIAFGAVGLSQLAPGAQVNESVNNMLITALQMEKANQVDVSAALGLKADKTEINSLATSKANQVDVNAALALKANQVDLNAQSTRIDSLVANAGNTSGNSEIIDIRVGANSELYASAGNAVRAVQNNFQFVKSKNRLNPNTFTASSYYDATNTVVTNASYDLSDFIYVHNHVGDTLYVSSKEMSPSTFPGYMVFDANKAPIRRVTGFPATYTVLATDYYIRPWFTHGNAAIYQYEFGTAITNFEPYFDDYYKSIVQDYVKPNIDPKYIYNWYRGDTDVTAGTGLVKHSSKLYRLSVSTLCYTDKQLKISMSDYAAYTFDLYYTDSNGIYITGTTQANNSKDVLVPAGTYFTITLKRVTENTSEVVSLTGDVFQALSATIVGPTNMKIVGYSDIVLSKLSWVTATLNFGAGYAASTIRMTTGSYLPDGTTIDTTSGFIPLPLMGTLKVNYTGNYSVLVYQYDETKTYKLASSYYNNGDEIVLRGYPYARLIIKHNTNDANIGQGYVSTFAITLQYKASNATESKELKPTKLRVMTNNVGVFNDGNSTEGVQTNVSTVLDQWKDRFATYMPDVVGLQELARYFDGANTMPTYETLLKPIYPYAYMSTHDNALLSKYPIYGVQTIMVGTTSNTTICRPIIKGYLYIDGKKICVVNCHLYFDNTTAGVTERTAQMNGILSAVANEKYVIIFGDFNNNVNGLTELSPFTNAGYKLVNGGYFSAIRTYNYNIDFSPTADTTKDLIIDNIIVSSNISINSRIVPNDRVTTDHLAVISDLVIY